VSAGLDLDSEDQDREAPRLADTARGSVRSPIGVKFTGAGKIYLFDAGDDHYRVGEEVVVETERGQRLGVVAVAAARREVTPQGSPHRAPAETRTARFRGNPVGSRSIASQPVHGVTRGPLRRVIRRPNKNDQRGQERNQERAAEILTAARELARELDIPAKVFRAELSLSGGKAVVYFSTEDKIDLRRLGRELSQRIHARVEMRQTGVRDEAKMVGGIGSCGLELCCTTWLPAFVPVSIKNAKDQGLVLNPSKVSGQCGRLKCCLVYEQETYAELRKGLPKLGKRVVTAGGEGRVVEVDVLRRRVRVSLGQGEMQVLSADEVKPMFPSQSPPGQPPGRRPPTSSSS
jgi:cell fate regulator YaaT (PSP1 superfamily)